MKVTYRQLWISILVTSVCSFALVDWLIGNDYVKLYGYQYSSGHVLSTGEALLACIQQKSATGDEGHVQSPCEGMAGNLLRAATWAPREQFNHHGNSFFDVFQVGRLIVMIRKSCTDSDLVVQTIGWSAWPANPEVLPQDRKQYGNFAGMVEFDKVGVRYNGACMGVVPLPLEDPIRIYVGQRRDDGRYDWMLELE